MYVHVIVQYLFAYVQEKLNHTVNKCMYNNYMYMYVMYMYMYDGPVVRLKYRDHSNQHPRSKLERCYP